MSMQNIIIKILEVKTTEQSDRFNRDYSDNWSYTKNKEFVVNVKALCDGVDVYFTHRLKFSTSIGNFGSLTYVEKNTDFAEYVKKETTSHIGGHLNDKKYFVDHGDFKPKIEVGSEIAVRCQLFEKQSKAGNKYFQLKRVKLAK